MQFFYGEGVAVGYGDDGHFLNTVFFIEGEFLLCFEPETPFALKRCRDDEFILGADVTVDPLCLKINPVFEHRQCYHTVKLGTERLLGGEVFGKGKIVKDHLFAAAFDGIVYEVKQTLFLETFDAAVDEIFGDAEVLLGKRVDLMNGHGLRIVTCKYEDE